MKLFGGLKAKLLPKWGAAQHTDTESPASSGRVRQILDDPPPPISPQLPPMVPQTPTIYSSDTQAARSLAPESEGEGPTRIRHRSSRRRRPVSSFQRRTPGKRPSRKLPPPPSTAGHNSWVTFKFGRYQGAPSTYTAPPSTYIAGQSMYSMTSPSARAGAVTDDGHDDENEEHEEREEHEEHEEHEEQEPRNDGEELASRPATQHELETEQLSPISPTDEGTNSEYYPRNQFPQSSVFPETATQGGGPSMWEGESNLHTPYPPESLVIGNHPNMVNDHDEGRTMTMTMSDEPLTPPGKEGLSRPATSIMTPITPRNPMSRRDTVNSRPEQSIRETMTMASTRASQLESQSDVGTTGGDLTRTNTNITRSTRRQRSRRRRDTRVSNFTRNGQNLVASPKSMRTSLRTSMRTSVIEEEEETPSPRPAKSKRLTRTTMRSNVRSSIFVRRPTNRFSHRPFHYFHRYPASGEGDSTKLDLPGIPSIAGTESTATTRTYISSRVGRLRRLWKDFKAMPWRADSDSYYGDKGITVTHHFRSHGGVGGGVSARPKRDSRIPRQPWYRPKPKVGMVEMRDNGAGLMTYTRRGPGVGSGPLTDGSDRNTMDRYVLPSSASPFVSPFTMRSPYDTPVVETPPVQFPPPPVYSRRTASRSPSSSSKNSPPPIILSNPFGKPVSRSPSTTSTGSHSRPHRNQHALLDSYGQGGMPPPIQEGRSPPSAHPDGFFARPPQPRPQSPPQQYLPAGPNTMRVPFVPQTAAPSAYTTDGPNGEPGIMIHSPGAAPVWVPIHPAPNHQTPQALYLMPNGMLSSGYQIAQPGSVPSYHMAQHPGVPVTMHATGSSAGVGPGRSRPTRKATGGTVSTTEYFPSTSGVEIGAAV
ncbi:hypothetical protein FRB96_009178 [Tulasnella sp. 330]|nr:hypothetical protein FRB96_009178 [Tulasnella sp. 330]KAG8880522.1 hypothetical protein FRB98_005028 [Tulasnella sp. 332]KAG8880909.1 hypothetical protein FRB97_000353 [Tulasnella sp. 331]